MATVDGNIVDDVSATTLCMLHNRGSEATSQALDRIGPLRRIRPRMTLLEFG